MKGEDKALLGVASVASGLTAVYALSSKIIPREDNVVIYLTVNASDGGTTIPERGVYQYSSTGRVVLKAAPFTGYYFNGWYLLGKLLSRDLTYTYNLTESVIISASFVKEDEPVLIPSYITPFEKTKANLFHNWELWKEAVYGTIGLFVYDRIHFRKVSFEIDTLMFKLCDKNGNGVPSQLIAVYTDAMPDATLFGNLRIIDARGSPPVDSSSFEKHTVDNPLLLTTNNEGTVEILCAYLWDEPVTGDESKHDYINTLGRSGKLKWNAPGFASGWVLPIWNLMRSPTYFYIPPFPVPPIPIPIPSNWSEWQLLLDPVYRIINLVHAYWVDNPSLLNMGSCSADCNIKMMSSTINIPKK